MNKNLTMLCLVGMTALMLTACNKQKKADNDNTNRLPASAFLVPTFYLLNLIT